MVEQWSKTTVFVGQEVDGVAEEMYGRATLGGTAQGHDDTLDGWLGRIE